MCFEWPEEDTKGAAHWGPSFPLVAVSKVTDIITEYLIVTPMEGAEMIHQDC